MCGIYGIVSWDGPLTRPERLDRMARGLRHRGPDGDRRVVGPTHALGTQHLRIVDPHGPLPQPCVDPTRRVVMVCNGEIYNASALKRRWPRFPYTSQNDVEVIVPAYLDLGAACFRELEGMFAIAILDLRAGELLLARDRAGEKPLFYARLGTECVFASEIPPLFDAGVPRRLSTEAIRELIALGYVREPATPFADVAKVPAGSVVALSRSAADRRTFWHPDEIEPVEAPDAGNAIESALRDAVEGQLYSSGPTGVFASGGLDSSLIASMAAAAGSSEIALFTVGFDQPSYDERAPVRRLATHLALPHVEVTATPASLCEAHERLTASVGEPLTDPAALPTWLLAREASRTVKVVLGGEGADELFGGYPTYPGHWLAEAAAGLPSGAMALLRGTANLMPVSRRKMPAEYLIKRFAAEARQPAAARHHAWGGSGLTREVPWSPNGALQELWLRHPGDTVRTAMLVDYVTYLREGLLPKIDRTTMQWSLEARAPFLDSRVTCLAFALPTRQRVRRWATKVLLRRVASRHLPAWVRRRRKRGLSVPLAALLAGECRADVDRHLARDRWPFPGVLESGRVAQLLSDHRSGRVDLARPIWTLYTIAKWHAHWAGDTA
ncbi:MAG TPA: asparagine synthase (glutamine-hydrolyzing) [Gemmatimonadales bacterium]